MSEHNRVSTTFEVYKSVRVFHPELQVFATYSAPEGDTFGDPDECVMSTEYGFKGEDFPIVGCKTTWGKNPDKPEERLNEETKYWLCVAVAE